MTAATRLPRPYTCPRARGPISSRRRSSVSGRPEVDHRTTSPDRTPAVVGTAYVLPPSPPPSLARRGWRTDSGCSLTAPSWRDRPSSAHAADAARLRAVAHGSAAAPQATSPARRPAPPTRASPRLGVSVHERRRCRPRAALDGDRSQRWRARRPPSSGVSDRRRGRTRSPHAYGRGGASPFTRCSSVFSGSFVCPNRRTGVRCIGAPVRPRPPRRRHRPARPRGRRPRPGRGAGTARPARRPHRHRRAGRGRGRAVGHGGGDLDDRVDRGPGPHGPAPGRSHHPGGPTGGPPAGDRGGVGRGEVVDRAGRDDLCVPERHGGGSVRPSRSRHRPRPRIPVGGRGGRGDAGVAGPPRRPRPRPQRPVVAARVRVPWRGGPGSTATSTPPPASCC